MPDPEVFPNTVYDPSSKLAMASPQSRPSPPSRRPPRRAGEAIGIGVNLTESLIVGVAHPAHTMNIGKIMRICDMLFTGLMSVDLVLLGLRKAEIILVDWHTVRSQAVELYREGIRARDRGGAVKDQDKSQRGW